MLLLVSNQMLGTCHHSTGLDTLHSLGDEDTGKNRIRTKALPVSATFRRATKWTGDGSQLDIGSLELMLFPHGSTAGVRKPSVPCGSCIDAGRENSVEVG